MYSINDQSLKVGSALEKIGQNVQSSFKAITGRNVMLSIINKTIVKIMLCLVGLKILRMYLY